MQMEVNLIPPLKTATNSISISLRHLPSPLHSILMLNLGAEHAVRVQICKTWKIRFLAVEDFILNSKSA